MDPARHSRMYPDKMLAALQVFECPVCQDRFKIPTFLCASSHGVCGSCVQGLEECPICSEKMIPMKNYVLEDVLSTYFNNESVIVADLLKGFAQQKKVLDCITKEISTIISSSAKTFLDLIELKEILDEPQADKSDENNILINLLNELKSKSQIKECPVKVIPEMENERQLIIDKNEVMEE